MIGTTFTVPISVPAGRTGTGEFNIAAIMNEDVGPRRVVTTVHSRKVSRDG
jgi:hypothetical protein